jgi:hypothetical protein
MPWLVISRPGDSCDRKPFDVSVRFIQRDALGHVEELNRKIA